jgi:hypothetical protein
VHLKDSSLQRSNPAMLISRERRQAIRTPRGWAISVLQEAGAIRSYDLLRKAPSISERPRISLAATRSNLDGANPERSQWGLLTMISGKSRA